jgi:hypothetical protein
MLYLFVHVYVLEFFQVVFEIMLYLYYTCTYAHYLKNNLKYKHSGATGTLMVWPYTSILSDVSNYAHTDAMAIKSIIVTVQMIEILTLVMPQF